MARTDQRDALLGLTSEEVLARIAEGKVNVNTDLKTKSVRQLVIENTCTLFNLINVALAVLVIATGAFKNLTFLGSSFSTPPSASSSRCDPSAWWTS